MMDGGQFRRWVAAHLCLALTSAAVVMTAFASVAVAGSPASSQYGGNLPSGGSGGGAALGKPGPQPPSGQPSGNALRSRSGSEGSSGTAGGGWIPFFIGGLVVLAAITGALAYRNRRRTAQG